MGITCSAHLGLKYCVAALSDVNLGHFSVSSTIFRGTFNSAISWLLQCNFKVLAL